MVDVQCVRGLSVCESVHCGGYLQVCTVAAVSRVAWVVSSACVVSVGQLVPVGSAAMVLFVVVGGIVSGLGDWVAIVTLGRWGS